MNEPGTKPINRDKFEKKTIKSTSKLTSEKSGFVRKHDLKRDILSVKACSLLCLLIKLNF